MAWSKVQDETLARLAAEIKTLTKELASLKGEKEYLDERRSLQQEVHDLKEQIEDLKIQKSRITEDHEKEKREVKHLVGLEKKRQEWEHEKAMDEVDNARRTAMLEVREENLTHEREAFEAQMKFITERFTQEIEAQRKMLAKLIPNIDIALNNERSGTDG